MPLPAVGERVGAIRDATPEKVFFFGYGVYEGRKMHPQWGIENPCIKLDSGDVVFGIECWWGPEDKVRDSIGDREVEIVPVPVREESDGHQ